MSTTTVDADAVAARVAEDGFAVVPDVLSGEEVADARARLWAAKEESERRGARTHVPGLDPNARNVRVFNLIDLDPVLGALLEHPVADAVTARLLGDDYVVSNLTANIARPGSGSMAVHSDQSLVHAGPWTEQWALNVIWCLSDVRRENGATLYAPGSHRYTTRDQVPDDPTELIGDMLPFEAPAGAIVVMEGRLWHTSGANVTTDEDRPLIFAYYSRSFLRSQWNFTASLRPEVRAAASPAMRYRLGLDIVTNRPPANRLQRS